MVDWYYVQGGPSDDCETELKEGQFGKFYGCKNFPECKGSRNY